MVAARVKHGGSDDLLTGLDAIRSVADHAHALELSLPVERGIVHDWNGIQQALASMYAHDLGGVDTDAYPVLVTQSPFASPKQREKLADLLFRQFRVPAMLICNSAVLSLFSSGLTTGLVLESGESATYTVPVFEGYALRHGIETMQLGGIDLTRHLTTELQRADLRLDIAREIKEKYAVVAPSSDVKPDLGPNVQYELPDGSMLEISDKVRLSTGELLFQQDIADLPFRTLDKCDSNLKPIFLNRIVTTGGSTLLRGFHERITSEITARAQGLGPGHQVNIMGKRKNAAWMGGSMLASLNTFSDIHITRQEFEDGDDIIHKKYF